MRLFRMCFFVLMLLSLAMTMVGRYDAPGVHAAGAPRLFLPVVKNGAGTRSPFLGVEIHPQNLTNAGVQAQAQVLAGKWVRMHGASWRDVQPSREGPLRWEQLSDLENDLQAIYGAGLSPIVIVQQYPSWATEKPIACSAIQEQYFGHFATFVRELVLRYKNPPYNVHDWELGNEPDVDPIYFDKDSEFGCWGNQKDRYYGGEHYGKMLKAVAPVIKSADPSARIFIGGLLLDNPTLCTSQIPNMPCSFLDGILTAGAAKDFDVVAYHAYAAIYDADKLGRARQKVQFLKSVMAKHGVSKPLVLTETALRCPADLAPVQCGNPDPGFSEAQADFLPRVIVRSLSDGVESAIWYTLNGPGWHNAGLLDKDQRSRPSYSAFQALGAQTFGAAFPPVNIGDKYGTAVEGYSFKLPNKIVDVVWSKNEGSIAISAPAGFIAAYDRDGKLLPQGALSTGTGVLYVHRQP